MSDQETDWKALVEKLESENQALRQSKQEILDDRKKAVGEAERFRIEAESKTSDLEVTDKSWQEKYDRDLAALKDEYQPKFEAMKKQIHNLTVGETARDIAKKSFVNTRLAMPHILPRLTLEETDKGSKVRVLDASGNITNDSIDDLVRELTADPDLAEIVSAGNASGAGYTRSSKGAIGGIAHLNNRRSNMNAKDVAKFVSQHGQSAYLKLPR
ncbi:hypothetical protein [Thalassospira lohafexi]|uniref:Uncharacterized protein n=1 Tax=Thalassospira lohafexi TaxID=744227 RepID=A0A2N3LBF3_9PROT|nr:hypothetical protein [Thalassospira lohafexi]PKR60076.1 hypothetical protein COO92_01500 [Thalassospira lohafexi]